MPPLVFPWWGVNKPPRLDYEKKILSTAGILEEALLAAKTPLDRALGDYIARKAGKLGSNDRAVLSLAAYGLARNVKTLLKALPGREAGEGTLLRTALYDTVQGDPSSAPPEIRPSLQLLEKIRGEASLVLERAGGKPCRGLDEETRAAFETLFSLPAFWLETGPWPTLEDAVGELCAGKFPQKPQIRLDASRTDRDSLLAALAQRGIKAIPAERSPWGVVLEGRVGGGALKGLPAELQDEGSQLAVLSCLPLEKGGKALDLCAGAGGKALLLAQVSDARIFLYDKDKKRLTEAARRMSDSGRENMCFTGEPEKDGPYDLVLIDAPCSSTGTLRRNPDVAARYGADHIGSFVRTQRSILMRGAEMVRPGGLLVYVTCSLLDPENSENINHFLRNREDFSPEPPLHKAFHGIQGAEKGVFRLPLTLSSYAGDGFFIARLRRK